MIQYPNGQPPIRFISVSPTIASLNPAASQYDVSSGKSANNFYMQPSQTIDPGISALLPLIGSVISLLANMLQSQGGNNFKVSNDTTRAADQNVAPSLAPAFDQILVNGEIPEIPETPETPGGPDTPDSPDTPDTPDTGGASTPPAKITDNGPKPFPGDHKKPLVTHNGETTGGTTNNGPIDNKKPVPPVSGKQPVNSVSVKDFGAVGDGSADDGAAIQKAIDSAKVSGKTVWLPPGTYNHSGKITLDGVAMCGAGEKSVLNATNPNSGAITLTGNNPSISNIQSVSANATDRSSMPDAANILVQNASGATVSNMKIIGAASNGIRLDGAHNSTISKNLVTGTNADGIALMNGSTGNMVQSNVVNQASDDSYSDDSYTSDAKQDEGNTFDSNVSMANAYGRGIVLAGSKNDAVTNNIVSGSKWYGIFADSDPNSGTMASSGHKISGNTVINNPNGAPIQATSPGTTVSGTKTEGNIPDLASVLGWDPGDIPDRTKITGYTPGTGSGANNSGGNRS